jgi:hypothetical protein
MLPPFLTMAVVHPRGEGCNDVTREMGSKGRLPLLSCDSATLKEEVEWPDIPARFANSVGGKGRSCS